MESVWRQSQSDRPVSVRAVFEDLRQKRPIAYTTVMSTMARLARKGMLSVETADQAYRYRPEVTRETLAQGIVERVIGSLLLNFEGETLSYVRELLGFGNQRDSGRAGELWRAIDELRAEERSEGEP